MPRISLFDSPFLLGFDQVERTLDRLAKSGGDGYPPYNIEQVASDGLRITIAVAGFAADELSVMLENNQLMIRGKQTDDGERVYLHRGIAARQFQRTFVMADGIEVRGADLNDGLLGIDLVRPDAATRVRNIEIKSSGKDKGRRSGAKALPVGRAEQEAS